MFFGIVLSGHYCFAVRNRTATRRMENWYKGTACGERERDLLGGVHTAQPTAVDRECWHSTGVKTAHGKLVVCLGMTDLDDSFEPGMLIERINILARERLVSLSAFHLPWIASVDGWTNGPKDQESTPP